MANRSLANPTTGETGAADAVTTSSDESVVDPCRPVVHKNRVGESCLPSEILTEADNTHMRWLVAAALWPCQNLVCCFATCVLIARQRAPSLGAHHRLRGRTEHAGQGTATP